MLVDLSHFLSVLSTTLFLLTSTLVLVLDCEKKHSSILIRRAFSHAFILLLLSFVIYVYLAATDDFSVVYISQHSNSMLPTFYKVTSIWSAHEGSMFLWILFLSAWGFVFNLNKDLSLIHISEPTRPY